MTYRIASRPFVQCVECSDTVGASVNDIAAMVAYLEEHDSHTIQSDRS